MAESVGRLFSIIAVALLLPLRAPQAATLLYDDFVGSELDGSRWHIPTWRGDCDGTFVGRTQFRTTQNSPLPDVSDSNVRIRVDTYNPTGFSFYGTDLISNQEFSVGQGISIKVRAKMNAPAQGGTVGGMFLYHLYDTSDQNCASDALHDEIDFELLGNRPGEVETNIYSDEPLGAGHPASYAYASGSVTEYHIYEIRWFPHRVEWLVDGTTVREETSHVPAGPMALHLNMWVPDQNWPEAYCDCLQPTSNPSNNHVFTMSVDWVSVESAPYTAIEGDVATANGTPICAMVLANGQYMFSCDGTGAYNLSVPLDANGQITLFAFADGFAPFSVTVGPDGFPRTVEMRTAAPNSPRIAMAHAVACAGTSNWVHIAGTIESYGSQPLCAMVLANGQQMFSCDTSLGKYDLTVPADENGNITLFGFADGFQPYRETFVAPSCGDVSL
jgi:hypothetical protein